MADSYDAAEERLGAALRGRRADAIIATKFGSRMHDRSNGPDWGARGSASLCPAGCRGVAAATAHRLDRSVSNALARRPDADRGDPIGARDLVHEGKVRYLGLSNVRARQVIDADWTARTRRFERFVCTHAPYNLLDRGAEAELIPALSTRGMSLIPYFPLASGLPTGKYERGRAAPKGQPGANRG